MDNEFGLKSSPNIANNIKLANRVATGSTGGSYLNAKRLGTPEPIKGIQTSQGSRQEGLRSKLLERPQYSENFARQAKRTLTKRGLTKAQRATQLNALNSAETMRQYGVDPESEQGRQIVDLTKASTKRGLTTSQRAGLADTSNDILANIVDPIESSMKYREKRVNELSFEDALAKELGILED